MNLVKIDGKYINADRVDGITSFGGEETYILVGGAEEPFLVRKNIDEVAAILEADKLENEKS